jgi:hypothetical protein
MELFWPFLKAVFSSWVETVGIILSIIPFVEKIPFVKEWLKEKPILERFVPLLWVIGGACIVWGFYAAWAEQYKTRTEADKKLEELTHPNLKVSIGQSLAGYLSEKGFTIWLPSIVIVNQGAPSAILGWKIHYKSPTLDQDVDFVRILNTKLNLPITGTDETFQLDPAETINLKRGTISTGDFREGRLIVRIPGDRAKEIGTLGLTITISIQDYRGTVFTGVFKGGEGATKDLRLIPGDNIETQPRPK